MFEALAQALDVLLGCLDQASSRYAWRIVLCCLLLIAICCTYLLMRS